METITTAATVDILNDLVAINNDRIEGYEKALQELTADDQDLKALFLKMIDESRKIRMDLAGEVEALGNDATKGTTAKGKLYRAWMEVKAAFTGHERHAVLANCERGEDAAQRAYDKALEEPHIPAYIRSSLLVQKQILKTSHDRIKNLRDMSK